MQAQNSTDANVSDVNLRTRGHLEAGPGAHRVVPGDVVEAAAGKGLACGGVGVPLGPCCEGNHAGKRGVEPPCSI